jgi:ankyrin repeat protein
VYGRFQTVEQVTEPQESRAWTNLHYAVHSADLVLINTILMTNPDINVRDPDMGRTVLHLAIALGHKDVVNRLLDASADQYAQTFNGLLPLQIAAIFGHEEVTVTLLQRSCNPNHRNRFGTTALYGAAANRRYSIARILLDFGADRNIESNEGHTASWAALAKGDSEMAHLLYNYSTVPPHLQTL